MLNPPVRYIRVSSRRSEQADVHSVLETRRSSSVKTWVKALRLHQWAKNLLIFVPLLAAHRFGSLDVLITSTLAFAAFGLCASAVYVLNDLSDLEVDRRHPRKRLRAFARGRLSPEQGRVAALLLMAAGLGLAVVLLPLEFLALLLLYLAVTTAYSLYLKRIILVDVILLAGLYSMRLFAGAVVTDITLSPWLLAFSTFLFLSLALVKRYAELISMEAMAGEPDFGRAYRTSDRDLLRSLGTASGLSAVLVLALYINSDLVVELYRRPDLLWLVCPPLLYWISRMWLVAHRGGMHDDPIVFTIKDPASYAVGGLVALIFLVSI